MTTEPLKRQSSARISFRSVIRYSIVLQVLVIAPLLTVTLWGALQTESKSDDFARETRNVLFLAGQGQEFDRSRAALRQYAASGKPFTLGAYRQSKTQMATLAFFLDNGLSGSTRARAEKLTDLQLRYLDSAGKEVVVLVRSGDLEAAQAALDSKPMTAKLNAATEAQTQLSREMSAREQEADRAVSNRQRRNAFLIAVSGLIILLTSVGLLAWIRSRTLVPLENLAVASRRLGHGDLSARVDPGGLEETALTGNAFNQMADEIEQHVGQLHELSVARSRFVSSVSHELRTPITSLRGYLELLAQGEAGELQPDQLRFIEIADRNARQLSDLIDDLLTLSRVQSGRMNMRHDRVNLRSLLHDLKAELLPIGADRGVDIVLVDTGDLIIQGDALRLRQAFGNLLSNAIKYSRDDQAVVVRALAVDRQAIISFVDWGVGIPREDLSSVAEPFFRSEVNESVPGTGLGLAIAKQMIEMHGGRLAVESELGSGSTFTVYLPLDQAAAATPDVASAGADAAESAKTSGD